jgi:hypothetical protein
MAISFFPILVEFTVFQGEAIEFAPLCKDWQTCPAALPKGQICRCIYIKGGHQNLLLG